MTRLTREDIARREVGHTDIAPGTARFLVVGFLSVILLVPVVQLYLEARNGEPPKIAGVTGLFASVVGTPQLPTPDQIKAFEDEVTSADWLRDAMLSPTQSVLTTLGAGNGKTWIGKNNWLFYEPGIRHLTGPGYLDEAVQKKRTRAGKNADPLAAITHFHEQLQARGIQLILAPIPVKPGIYPEKLSNRYTAAGPPPTQPDDSVLFEQLRERGITVVDLTADMTGVKQSEPAYLETDTHWTPAGMAAAAERIAEHYPRNHGPAAWHQTPKQITNHGDLTVMLKLPEGQTRFPQETVTIQRITNNAGEPWRPDPKAEILLLGDSFTNIYSMEGLHWGEHAGLAEHLSHSLNRPIDRIAVNDNGAFSTRDALARALARGENRLAGKKVVIWEFSARELSQGDWRLIDLPKVAPLESQSPADHPTEVGGVITAISKAPKPGTAPYRDAVIALSLDDEKVIYLWGLQDNKTMPANSYRVGDRLQCTLIPWRKAAPAYGGYQRLELQDRRTFELPVYWAEDHRIIVKATADEEEKPETKSIAEPPRTVKGKDDWLFFGPELKHLAADPWWEASTPEDQNPLIAIVDFKQQLDRLGVELLLMPVPTKASIYPEHLPDSLTLPEENLDRRFLKALQEAGIETMDLTALFQAEKARNLYLKTDTHWSPQGIALAAQTLMNTIQNRPWLADMETNTYLARDRQLEISGDLREDETTPLESVTITRIKDGRGRRARAPKPWRESPILLMGDSHTLVFHAGGDLFARGAGLPDLLALNLGFPVDLIGVRGSGATATRLDLMRREDNLAGKKLVIWVFSVREFTQGARDWSKVPVTR
ncbi:MAG: hypothetical protein QNK37_32020 [Acidobacteriota bacterium]|nr:hypothetical protein [Acidobacteriota bacterium]